MMTSVYVVFFVVVVSFSPELAKVLKLGNLERCTFSCLCFSCKSCQMRKIVFVVKLLSEKSSAESLVRVLFESMK